MVCRGRCVVDRCSIGRGRIGLSLTRVTTGRGGGVDSLSRVGHLGDVAVDVVGGVGDGLDPAVGEGDGVRATDNTVGISGLSSVEVGLGVVVGNTVGVGVGLRGLLDDLDDRSSVGRGSVHNGGGVDDMMDRRSMDCVDKRSVHCMSKVNAVSHVGDVSHLGAGQAHQSRDHEGLKFGHQ